MSPDPVVVTAYFHPLPGKREELLEALRIAIPGVHDEPGCLLYAIQEAPDGTIVMIEKWESEALLDEHGSSAAVAAAAPTFATALSSPVAVTRLSPIPIGDAAKGAL
jgi:quinol monooxygenase YgiN